MGHPWYSSFKGIQFFKIFDQVPRAQALQAVQAKAKRT